MNARDLNLAVFGRKLYEREVVRRILALYEDLVRHDENLAAFHLLDKAVPYFARDDPELLRLKADSWAGIKHVFEPEAYAAYYATNVHEQPFELMYGCEPEQAHERLPRVAFLRERLEDLWRGRERRRLLDLGANDGWLAVNLAAGTLPRFSVDCVDLHAGNIAHARERAKTCKAIRGVEQGEAVSISQRERSKETRYDAVVAFELIEHVADPAELVEAALAVLNASGRLFVSTPEGAVEGGHLPGWAVVEPKGHVRALSEADLRAYCSNAGGSVERLFKGEDGVMVAEVAPG